MNLRMRYFSPEEADALIPSICGILEQALETRANIERKVSDWRRQRKSLDPAGEAVLRGQVDFLANQLEAQLGEIAELGCLPKDLDSGLVDFPARIDGREVYLCWKKGEDRVRHYHGITDGFRGRKALHAKDVK